MNIANSIENIFKKVLPTPLTIAVLLTFFVFLLALIFAPENNNSAFQLINYWEDGLWNAPLIVFAFQMMLMLVLGHILALSNLASSTINRLSNFCSSTANTAAIVCFFTLLVSFFNWGLGLIFGAIFARKVAESAKSKNQTLYYPIIGAAGYSGLMVWHGGFSGSAPLKVAEKGHLAQLLASTSVELSEVPASISFSETIFSDMNLAISLVLITALPALFYVLGKTKNQQSYPLPAIIDNSESYLTPQNLKGAEKLDSSTWFTKCIGFIVLSVAFCKIFVFPETINLSFINPNFINLTLLGFAFLLHKNIHGFLKALDSAIGGASGILIQFPLYFGIMGIMKYSGLAGNIASYSNEIASIQSFPILTFLSAGILNIFVPSGGGQWGVQGPILIESALNIGVPLPKAIMSLAYGDQLTNMLQPFWALPLLGITGLKAKAILPYTLMAMALGLIIFILGLLLF